MGMDIIMLIAGMTGITGTGILTLSATMAIIATIAIRPIAAIAAIIAMCITGTMTRTTPGSSSGSGSISFPIIAA